MLFDLGSSKTKTVALCADIHREVNEFSSVVAELEWSCVQSARNQYRRAWASLALKRHTCELFELTDIESAGFWREVAAVARALDSIYQPAKMNYAVFGNLSPHIHRPPRPTVLCR